MRKIKILKGLKKGEGNLLEAGEKVVAHERVADDDVDLGFVVFGVEAEHEARPVDGVFAPRCDSSGKSAVGGELRRLCDDGGGVEETHVNVEHTNATLAVKVKFGDGDTRKTRSSL